MAKIIISVRLDGKLLARLRKMARQAKTGQPGTMTEIIERGIELALRETSKKRGAALRRRQRNDGDAI